MKSHTFTAWLYSEVTSARGALLTGYEQLDKMRFQDAPRLEQQYMEQVGAMEEAVIRQEIEAELLKEKRRMIQAAINCRQPIDEAAIDAAIDRLRQEKLQEAVGVSPPDGCYDLTGEQLERLQELYRKIVKQYHPQMHPEMTEAQRDLFDRAQEAYRRRDLEALGLIYDMLVSTEGEPLQLTITLEFSQSGGGEIERRSFSTDYALAGKLYSSFVPTAEEVTLREELERCRQKQAEVMAQVEALKQEFPFAAAEMLADPKQIEAYRKQLEHRKYEAEQTICQLTESIRSLTERMVRYE